ncbi:hypothetical protein [Methylosinus sp. RM1]|uniref:hypothetical protein n=1 Tax=Methylosinus sp. RM1 TaxID=2583817 RepID=UPI001A9C5A22
MSALLPTVSANLQVNQQYESFFGIPGTRQFAAQVSGALNAPIYQGGVEYASIRQAKAATALGGRPHRTDTPGILGAPNYVR